MPRLQNQCQTPTAKVTVVQKLTVTTLQKKQGVIHVNNDSKTWVSQLQEFNIPSNFFTSTKTLSISLNKYLLSIGIGLGTEWERNMTFGSYLALSSSSTIDGVWGDKHGNNDNTMWQRPQKSMYEITQKQIRGATNSAALGRSKGFKGIFKWLWSHRQKILADLYSSHSIISILVILIIYIRVHSWCCTIYGFGQMHKDTFSIHSGLVPGTPHGNQNPWMLNSLI